MAMLLIFRRSQGRRLSGQLDDVIEQHGAYRYSPY
jgi:hypothetical protein